MKKLLLSLLCVASSLAASAALKSVVYYFNDPDGSGSDAYGMTRTSDNNYWNPEETTLTPSIEQETVILRGKNHHRLWSDGLRMYNGSSMEVSVPAGYVLTTIKIQTKTAAMAEKFTLADGCPGTYQTGKITVGTAGTEEVDGGTWTGSASSVTFNDNQSSNAVILSLTVNYEEDKYQPAGLSFPQESYEATIGQTFTKPELTKATDAVVTYDSSDKSVATVDATTGDVTLVGAGVTVITATAPQTDTYRAGSASYTLNVTDPNAPVVETLTDELYIGRFTNITGNSYTSSTYTSDETGIVYTAKIAKGNNAIQMNKDSSSSKGRGIAITSNTNGYVLKSVSVEFNTNTTNGRKLHVYGSDTAFASISDVKTNGTEIESVTKTADILSGTIEPAQQYTAVGFLATEAIYVEKITLVWAKASGETRIESGLSVDEAPIEWFDLSGRRVAAPAKGIYLRKQGAKVTKIAL